MLSQQHLTNPHRAKAKPRRKQYPTQHALKTFTQQPLAVRSSSDQRPIVINDEKQSSRRTICEYQDGPTVIYPPHPLPLTIPGAELSNGASAPSLQTQLGLEVTGQYAEEKQALASDQPMWVPEDNTPRDEGHDHCDLPNGTSQSGLGSCPLPSKVNRYGLISLFDGCSSVHDAIMKAIGDPGPRTFFGLPTWKEYGGRITWTHTLGKGKFGVVFKKANDAAHLLLNTLKITTVSVRARAIFYGTYCLSKFTYVATYNVVSPQDIHNLQVRVARAVLHRPWLQACHLPGVLRCLRIAPMQDLEIACASAAVGLLERRAATDQSLKQYLCAAQPEYRCDRQLETAITYLERYLPSLPHRNVVAIQHALKKSRQWADHRQSNNTLLPCVQWGEPSNEASPQQSGLQVSSKPHCSTSLGLVKHFKLGMKISREEAAMEYLRERTATSWSAAPSYIWLQALTKLHPRLCGAIPRYAALRWAVSGETDTWFWSHFHRLGPRICGCGLPGDTYPGGLHQAPLAEHHYAELSNPIAHFHADYEEVLHATVGSVLASAIHLDVRDHIQ